MSESAAGTADPASGRIVVGLDGSPSSEEALRWALHQAALTGWPVEAVIAWELPPYFGYAPGSEIDFRGEAAEVLEASVRAVVGAEGDVPVSRLVLRGHPARVLLDASDGARLLVVGSRGRGGFAGMLLGSVSQHVIAQATCPVVVLHDRGVPAPAGQAGGAP
jgi:nucleotide-binding universal stress UspA family protein